MVEELALKPSPENSINSSGYVCFLVLSRIERLTTSRNSNNSSSVLLFLARLSGKQTNCTLPASYPMQESILSRLAVKK